MVIRMMPFHARGSERAHIEYSFIT